MIDLETEGYVAVSNNKIPLTNYLFYLTYSNRADVFSNISDVDFTSKDIYKINADYQKKLRATSTRQKGVEMGELVVSFSAELCTLAIKYKFKNNIDAFKKSFMSAVVKILKAKMEQSEFAVFIHEYDSTQMRVHAHVLFYPYINKGKMKLKTVDPVSVHQLKVWIDEGRLKEIKKSFNNYAKFLMKGLGGKSVEVNKVDFPTQNLMELIRVENKYTTNQKHPKSNLGSMWEDSKVKKIKEILNYLASTTSDKKLDKKYDFSLVVDYLYDFDDTEAKQMFFNHAAIKNILKSFNLYKSKPKYATTIIKVLGLTDDQEILALIEKKMETKKAAELKNLLIYEYIGDTFLKNNTITRAQTMTK